MTIWLQNADTDNSEELHELNDFILEQNIKGLTSEIPLTEPEPNSLSATDYEPWIKLALQSAAGIATSRILVQTIKSFFEYKTQKVVADTEDKRIKLQDEQFRIAQANDLKKPERSQPLQYKLKKGTKEVVLSIAAASAEEREQIIALLQKI